MRKQKLTKFQAIRKFIANLIYRTQRTKEQIEKSKKEDYEYSKRVDTVTGKLK